MSPVAWKGFATTPRHSTRQRVRDRISKSCCTASTTSRHEITSASLPPARSRCASDIGQLICDARTEGVRLAIASSSKLENVVGLLRANLGPNADTWFDAIASGDVVAAKKPSPEIYLWTLRQLNLPAA